MNEYSFMNEGSLTRLVVDLFEPGKGVELDIGGIAQKLRFENLGRVRNSKARFTLDEIETAVKGLFERNVLYDSPTVKGAYIIGGKDSWRTDKQYSEYLEYQRWVGENSFMREGTLTRRIVDLFGPKEDGATFGVGLIAGKLGVRIPKKRSWGPKDKKELVLYGLEKAIEELSKMRNVLYKRTGPYAAEAYAINNKHLWRNDKQYREWRGSRLSKMFSKL